MAGFVTTEHIDYLQRLRMAPAALGRRLGPDEVPAVRRLVRVRGIGRHGKGRRSQSVLLGGQPDVPELGRDLGARTSSWGSTGTRSRWRTWSGEHLRASRSTWWTWASDALADAQQGIITALLRGLYPAVEFEPADQPDLGSAAGRPGVGDSHGQAPDDRRRDASLGPPDPRDAWIQLGRPGPRAAGHGRHLQRATQQRAE